MTLNAEEVNILGLVDQTTAQKEMPSTLETVRPLIRTLNTHHIGTLYLEKNFTAGADDDLHDDIVQETSLCVISGHDSLPGQAVMNSQ